MSSNQDDQPDYSFMRSGFNAVEAAVDEEETQKNAVSLIVAYAEGAMRTSAKYIVHGNRKIVTPEDLKRGMMLEMFLFKHRDDTLDKAKEIKEELFGNGAVDDDESLDDLEYADDECLIFKESECKCALCHCMNTIYERWEVWEPSSPFEKIFQTHINNMN